jgi:ABC-2 type transport system ATP-binding protein
MQIAMGVRRADTGRVRWEGRAAGERDRLRFGYMPEARGLYPRMRVLAHLVYLARLRGMDPGQADRAARRWLGRVEIGHRAESRVEELSSGNQQRVQLAAAMLHDPDLLILDEPFAGLDPIVLDRLAEVVRDRARAGAAVVLSTHMLDLAEDMCDEVVVIDHGRAVLAGSLDELRNAGPRRLRVEGPSATGWARGLPGVTVVEEGEARVVVELTDSVDPQEVLRRAMEAGPVTFFGVQTPRLSELFRRAVQR